MYIILTFSVYIYLVDLFLCNIKREETKRSKFWRPFARWPRSLVQFSWYTHHVQMDMTSWTFCTAPVWSRLILACTHVWPAVETTSRSTDFGPVPISPLLWKELFKKLLHFGSVPISPLLLKELFKKLLHFGPVTYPPFC